MGERVFVAGDGAKAAAEPKRAMEEMVKNFMMMFVLVFVLL